MSVVHISDVIVITDITCIDDMGAVLPVHATLLFLFVFLLQGLCLGKVLCLTLRVVPNHHHCHEHAAYLAKQSGAPEYQVAGGYQCSDAKTGDVTLTDVVEKVGEHVGAVAAEKVAEEVGNTFQRIAQRTHDAFGF